MTKARPRLNRRAEEAARRAAEAAWRASPEFERKHRELDAAFARMRQLEGLPEPEPYDPWAEES